MDWMIFISKRCQLFSTESDEPIGKESYQEYVKLGFEQGLTTGKPETTSNGDRELGATSYINDGYIARWDH